MANAEAKDDEMGVLRGQMIIAAPRTLAKRRSLTLPNHVPYFGDTCDATRTSTGCASTAQGRHRQPEGHWLSWRARWSTRSTHVTFTLRLTRYTHRSEWPNHRATVRWMQTPSPTGRQTYFRVTAWTRHTSTMPFGQHDPDV